MQAREGGIGEARTLMGQLRSDAAVLIEVAYLDRLAQPERSVACNDA